MHFAADIHVQHASNVQAFNNDMQPQACCPPSMVPISCCRCAHRNLSCRCLGHTCLAELLTSLPKQSGPRMPVTLATQETRTRYISQLEMENAILR